MPRAVSTCSFAVDEVAMQLQLRPVVRLIGRRCVLRQKGSLCRNANRHRIPLLQQIPRGLRYHGAPQISRPFHKQRVTATTRVRADRILQSIEFTLKKSLNRLAKSRKNCRVKLHSAYARLIILCYCLQWTQSCVYIKKFQIKKRISICAISFTRITQLTQILV